MRAPFRESPDWGWHEEDPHVPDSAPVLTVVVEDADGEWLVDVKGDPLFTEDEPSERFGFCSQRENEETTT